MPQTSEIHLLREFALYMGIENVLFEKSILTEDKICTFLQILAVSRKSQNLPPVPKSLDWYHNILCTTEFDDNRFRCQLRMDRTSFNYIVHLLKGNNVYNDTQEALPLQISVGLYRVGTYGNAASLKNVATKFGISEGSVVNFTNRLVEALRSMKGVWIRWPDEEERKSLSASLAEEFVPKCVGFVDGSDVPLAEAPIHNKVYYWSRKKRYSIQFQIVCDKNKLIRDFFTGYPGSVHDVKVFTSSPFGRNIHRYLTNDQFIIGDSAYPISSHVIVPFKRRGGNLAPERKNFNKEISKYRVAVEHTIGILKGRFQSLTELRVKVSAIGHQSACQWIEACCILHNILQLKDPWNKDKDAYHWEPEEDEGINDSHPDFDTNARQEKSMGEQKRLNLMQEINSRQY